MRSPWMERLSELPLAPQVPAGPVVVLSAHPDDEVLAVGAWLAGRTDAAVIFVIATDGEASHPGNAAISPDELRVRRPVELRRALEALGLESPAVHRLGLPDGGLSDNPDRLVAEIRPWVESAGVVLAPFEADGHPDHDALGAAALAASGLDVPVWRFPIWTWAWTRPAAQDWLDRTYRLPSTDDAMASKRAALAAFTSQVEPVGEDAAVVTDELMTHAVGCPEVVVIG